MRSNERSTSATKGAARSPTSAAAAAARLERWNSITWTDSRARTGTMSTGSGSSAARTTSMRRSRSTDGPSWNEHVHRLQRAELAPDDAAEAPAATGAPGLGRARQRTSAELFLLIVQPQERVQGSRARQIERAQGLFDRGRRWRRGRRRGRSEEHTSELQS